MGEPTQKVTFYMSGSHFTTYLTDEHAAQVKDVATACWKGGGNPALSVGTDDGTPPVLINLTRVDLIQTEEVTAGGQLRGFLRGGRSTS